MVPALASNTPLNVIFTSKKVEIQVHDSSIEFVEAEVETSSGQHSRVLQPLPAKPLTSIKQRPHPANPQKRLHPTASICKISHCLPHNTSNPPNPHSGAKGCFEPPFQSLEMGIYDLLSDIAASLGVSSVDADAPPKDDEKGEEDVKEEKDEGGEEEKEDEPAEEPEEEEEEEPVDSKPRLEEGEFMRAMLRLARWEF